MSLDPAQLTQALRALYTYITRKSSDSSAAASSQLFEEDQFIYLQLSLKRTPNRSTTKPYPLPLPHPLYTAGTELCLITKDPPPVKSHPTALSTSTAPNAIKRYFAAHPVPGLSRVIGVTKLRKEYGRFKQRRELLALYDLFLADDRIVPLLPAVLGVKFFDKKKQPIPVDLSRAAKEKSVQAALRSTYLFIPTGSSLQVKVGRSSMSRQQVHDNVMAVIGRAVDRLPGKWRGVQMVGIKCGDSITIPVYQSLPLQAIRGGAAGERMEENEEDEAEEDEDAVVDADEDSEKDEVAEEIETMLSKLVQESGKKRKRNEPEEQTKAPPTAAANSTPARTPSKTPAKTPLAKTPLAQSAATPKQTNGASAGKRVAAMLRREEEPDEEEEDELEVTLHPDLLDGDEDEPSAVQSNKKVKQLNGSAAKTPSRPTPTAAPAKSATTPATASRARPSTAPSTPSAAADPATASKGRRGAGQDKEAAEVLPKAANQATPKASNASTVPATTPTPKRKRPAEDDGEQQEAAVTPVAKKASASASKTPATTRTASKKSVPAVGEDGEAEETQKAAEGKPNGKAKKAVSARSSLPANAGVQKAVQSRSAPASARKSKA